MSAVLQERLINSSEMREILGGISYPTLRARIREGKIVPPVEGLGGLMRWRLEDVHAWVRSKSTFQATD